MHPVDALIRLGGTATARQLLRLTSRHEIQECLSEGLVKRVARGRYALPIADATAVAAARLGGTVCLRSAAAHHGLGLKSPPRRPDVAVNPRSHVMAPDRRGVRVWWMNVADDEREAGVTSVLKTVLDCARHLPFDEALAIADSALREKSVTREELDRVAVRGRGTARVRRVLRHATARSANPFESVLRALCIDLGLEVEAQGAVRLGARLVHPDLVCRGWRMAIEADSFTFHTGRDAHLRDCTRYNLLVLHGWHVLRFTWEQVMFEQDYVRWMLRAVAARVEADKVA